MGEEEQSDASLTTVEEEELKKLFSTYPRPDEKHGIFQFLNEILKTKDTSKGAYVDKEELFSIRARQDGALYFRLMGSNIVAEYLTCKGEITLATSDSKDGFLVKQAITQKRDVRVGSGEKKKKSTWMKKKEESGGGD